MLKLRAAAKTHSARLPSLTRTAAGLTSAGASPAINPIASRTMPKLSTTRSRRHLKTANHCASNTIPPASPRRSIARCSESSLLRDLQLRSTPIDFGTLIWPHFGRLMWPHLIYSDRSSYPVPASRDGEGDGQETQGGTV